MHAEAESQTTPRVADAAAAARPPGSFTVLTINMHKGFSLTNRRFVLPELREAVRRTAADVVFLQEVLGVHTGHARRHPDWPDAPQYEFLADSMWPQFAYGQNAVYPDGHHGNALLSKFPILRHSNLDVSITGPEKRGLLHSVLQLPGWDQEVHTICVHLGLREGHRAQQLELMCHLINEGIPQDAPLVVAGDFNDWRLRAQRVLSRCAGLHDPFLAAYGESPRTFPAHLPLLRLDRIYVRNVRAHLPVVLSTKPWSHLSDHAPLAVEVRPLAAARAATVTAA